MSNDPKNPQIGGVAFEGEEFTYLVDLDPSQVRGLMAQQPGFGDVMAEIIAHQQEWGERAGMTAEDFARFQLCNERLARIGVFLPPLLKFVKMLTGTKYVLEDERQRAVLNLAQSVDRRSVREPQLLARYETTRAYRSAIARKGMKTRKRNQAAKAAQAAQPPAATPDQAPEQTSTID